MIITAIAAALVAAQPTGTAAVLEHVRQAVHYDALAKHPEGLMIRGRANFLGEDGDYSIVFDGAGRFAFENFGRLSRTMAYDGKTAWEIDFQGTPRTLELGDRAQGLLSTWFITNQWLAPDSPLHFEPEAKPEGEGFLLLRFDVDQGKTRGTVRVSQSTWLPDQIAWAAGQRKESITLTRFADHTGVQLAETCESVSEGAKDTYALASAEPAPSFLRSPYQPRLAVPPATFDATASGKLEVRKAPTGHLLVNPKITGHDLGAFIFDTGAGSTVIDPAIAKTAGFEQFGSVPVVGVGGATKGSFYQPDSISLGPVTLDKPILVGSDLSFLKPFMGETIAGVIGFDFLSRCVVEIDLAEGRITLHDPSKYALASGQWTDLVLYGKHPCVRGSFEGHDSVFRLDTGAANTTLTMHAPAVAQFNLLDDRETTTAMLGGVGGMVKAKAGTLKSLDLGGRHFENVHAEFATEPKGAFADLYTAGNVGGGIIGRFTLVLDYGHNRIAFIERPGDK